MEIQSGNSNQIAKRRMVSIGIQDFGDLIRKNCFYVDKTDFIREWWES